MEENDIQAQLLEAVSRLQVDVSGLQAQLASLSSAMTDSFIENGQPPIRHVSAAGNISVAQGGESLLLHVPFYSGDFAVSIAVADPRVSITVKKGRVIIGGATLTEQPSTNTMNVMTENKFSGNYSNIYLRIYFDANTLKTELTANAGDISQVSGSIYILLGIAQKSGSALVGWEQTWLGGSIQLPSRPA